MLVRELSGKGRHRELLWIGGIGQHFIGWRLKLYDMYSKQGWATVKRSAGVAAKSARPTRNSPKYLVKAYKPADDNVYNFYGIMDTASFTSWHQYAIRSKLQRRRSHLSIECLTFYPIFSVIQWQMRTALYRETVSQEVTPGFFERSLQTMWA